MGTAKLRLVPVELRHDFLCLLRKALHDDDRIYPPPGVPRARLGVLDRIPRLRRASLGALREAESDLQLPGVRGSERVVSAGHRHRGRRTIAKERQSFRDVPRLIAPIASLVGGVGRKIREASRRSGTTVGQ
jgi:hypothetical protein